MQRSRVGWMILVALMCAGAVVRGETTLFDFYATGCGPCQAMAPAVDALARDGYVVERVNVDQDREFAARFGVTAVPCFVVVERGREVDRIVGQTTVERLKVKLQRRPARVEVDVKKGQPHPAWRYERPIGHRAAVVRIYCQDDARTRSIGSGVLVRWGKRIVVLTARHVVQDAKKITVELHTKRMHYARVVKVDVVWDCAVLELVGQPEGVEPAQLELGDAAMQREGNRLESCGYGPDGQLACNAGLFLGYRRSTQAQQGPDDWMEISGHARGGDSGGPIFNQQGRVVGVLWGTDGQHVVGVQAGRIHKLLDEAVPERMEQKALVSLVSLERKPTPPLPDPGPSVQSLAPLVPVPAMLGDPTKQESARQIFGRKPIPQPPQVVVQPDPEVRQALGNIDAKLGTLVEQRQTQPQSPANSPKPEEPSPLLAGLCIVGAIVIGFVIYFAGSSKS
jgi:thioredoxin 1